MANSTSDMSWLVNWSFNDKGDIVNEDGRIIADFLLSASTYIVGVIPSSDPEDAVSMSVLFIGKGRACKPFSQEEISFIQSSLEGRGFQLDMSDSMFYENEGHVCHLRSNKHDFKLQKFDNGYTFIVPNSKTEAFKSLEKDLLGIMRSKGM